MRNNRSLRIEVGDGIANLPRCIGLLSAFTDITSVTIFTNREPNISINLYVAIISCLSTLLFYDDIGRLEFRCRSEDFWWASENDDEAEGTWPSPGPSSQFNSQLLNAQDDTSSPGSNASDLSTYDSDNSDFTHSETGYPELPRDEGYLRTNFLSFTNGNGRDKKVFLGRFISNNAFDKLTRTGRIRFPRNLKFFKADIERYLPFCCVPLRYCRNPIAISIRVLSERNSIIENPGQPDETFVFPSIKALEIPYGYSPNGAEVSSNFATQFPNLTSLTVISPEVGYAQEIIRIPNFLHLEYLHIPSILWEEGSSSTILRKMQDQMMQRLKAGEFPVLRTYKVSGTRDMGYEGLCSGEATGVISRHVDTEDQNECLKFEWTNDIYDIVQSDIAADLDKLWDSGEFFKDTRRDDGEPEEFRLDRYLEELGTDESIYGSEDERIEIDRKRDIKKARRRKARRRRERIIEEDNKWAEPGVTSEDEWLGGSSRSQQSYGSEDEETRGEKKEDGDEKEGEDENGPLLPYAYVDFENVTNVVDVGSETSSIAESEGEEEDDEIGHTASQYLSLSIDDEGTVNPEDSDEYEDSELNENDTQGMLNSYQDPQFDVSDNNCRWEEEDNKQYESQYSQFDTQEYLANAANMAQETPPKPVKSINLTMDPREVEKIRNKNLYRR
ncbi:hypothetical protein AOL_s00169g117 [Orbilia oligospora ATCC 24927]|uniref:Uncharacterized protein n=1 Tax=Arthrobotrys oligospora (strain ATCC 24927 / CBS 115.81 / DSM 1491) TaxID=756982 RepID=G1XMR4_ARTOA|nr:hypothetical protein AOL_s00169g117 [Orbilia oligospora ATCC 24927]EGX45511.1 hypothetical protein AOL_s00169g117 [Orbilia oligospora ATCC 24927]